ncbi:MAG: hypothetical protein ACI9M3_000828 [Bacteroidia bacterium]|jgi:hypothetical protein
MKQIEKVKELITNEPFLRDSKKTLIATMLVQEGLTGEEAVMVANNFTKAASIVRASCRLQQTIPELRGREYNDRQLKQDEIKKELGYKV